MRVVNERERERETLNNEKPRVIHLESQVSSSTQSRPRFLNQPLLSTCKGSLSIKIDR